MALLLKQLNPAISHYRDRRFNGSQEQFEECLRQSTTIYVGNLSFYTTEDQLYEARQSMMVFSKAGDIKRIIMGLDKHKMTPCGFCFVVYYTREEAEACVKYINGTVLDGRPIRADFDWGFAEGRQFGRGRSGGQVRDEYRMDYDPGRGGYGTILRSELTARQQLVAMMGDEMNLGDMGGYKRRRRSGGGGGGGAGAGLEENPRLRGERESDDEH